MSLDEVHVEILSLLEQSKDELNSGQALTGLSMLFEAQFVLNRMVQIAMESVVGLYSKTANADTTMQ